jgi:hypothetical protein
MIEEEAARVGKRVRVEGSREGETERGVLLAKSCFRETWLQGFQILQRRTPPPTHSKVVDSTR